MWLKIKVLLWKSLQIRKRHWLCTIIELIVPCVLFFFMSYVRIELSSKTDGFDGLYINQTIPSPVPEEKLFQYFKAEISPNNYFIYTPKTSKTTEIMDLVVEKLAINNIDTAINEKEMVQKLRNIYSDTENYNGFGIVFEETLRPNVFKYKLRNTNDVWYTNLLFPKFEIPGPMNYGDVYLEKGFISLQLALDKAFIALSTNNNHTIFNMTDYQMEIQSYPYTGYSLDSVFQQIYRIFFPLFTVLSFLLMCSYTIKRVVEEKDTGVKELMKMMGLKSWMIWTGWVLHNVFVYVISITIITHITCFESYTSRGPLLRHTDPLLFWIFLITYMITGTFFCFAISSLFNRPIIALISGSMIWCLSYILPKNILKSTTSIEIHTFFMLLPNVALTKAYKTISSLESQEIGLRFSTLFTTEKGYDDFSVGSVLIFFIVQCFLYGFIAWYMDLVMPGKYGIAKPINILWSETKTEHDVVQVPTNQSNSKLFEKPPNNYEVGISVQNLHKNFGNFCAVNGVNLDLYKGQITALLGHNGAGKTTTMSIITGLFSPTSGSVKINGNDLFSNIDQFRDNLGLCPQHNLLFSYLTTLDHLIFFGMLKGMSLQKAKLEGLHLLKLLNILQKKNKLVSKLSGGMKRKVSLAIALIGNPEILILDEPTSGMDPESRREMWDLLLALRGPRTILITTHFMEEADVLGDRIAIMDHGQVKCYGTSLFLKKAYGTGYNLTILKEELCNESNLIAEIKQIIPEAEIQSSFTAQMVINLPNEHTNKFPDVFRMLETKRKEFFIKGMGISCTTMEEVFLRAGKNVLDDNDELSNNTPVDAISYQLVITKQTDCNDDQVTNLVQTYVSEYSLMSNTKKQIIYNLPGWQRNQFGQLFSAFENQKESLKLLSVKITHSLMGDIYPNLSSLLDDENELEQPSNSDDAQSKALMTNYTRGLNLLKNQFQILLEKKVIYTYRRWLMTLVFMIGPVLLSVLVMRSTYKLFSDSTIPRGLNLSLSTYKDSSVYFRVGDNSTKNLGPKFVAISKKNHATVNVASPENNIISDLLKMCKEDVFEYRKSLMIAGDFNATNSTVIYNNIAIHTPAIAINLYSNALLQQLSGNTESHISTVNEPIQLQSVNECTRDVVTQIVIYWLTIFTPGLLFLIGYFIGLPLNERVSGIKHIQMMTKLSPIMYWTTNFIWDYFCYFIVTIFTLFTIYVFDKYHIFTDSNELNVLTILLLIYGLSAIWYAYVYSFFTKTHTSSMLLFIAVNFIIGLFINNVMYIMKDIIREKNIIDPFNYWNIFRYITLIIPHFSYSASLSGFLQIAWENNRCKICNSTDMARICKSSTNSTPKNYFVFKSDENHDGILEETLFLLFSSVLYITIILLFDYKIFACIYQYGSIAIFGTGIGEKEVNEDPDISTERNKVNDAKTRPHDTVSPILLVDDLVKKFSFKFTGVRGISFTVSPGECFGLLGVNGAGKTTTFRILTGDTFPSKGDASILTDKSYKLSTDIDQYVSLIGYCPQFDALNGKLTGKETLKLIAILKGIPPLKVKEHVDKWIKLLGLNEYKDRLCGKYSGGNKRKLNTAMALIGDPPVVFLDEPTSGLDPVARRNLWKVLAASQKSGQAVILTSHSMDECEALCNRLTIMVDGVMKCIGNIQYLKNRYGQGFTIMIKLSDAEIVNVTKLKADVEHQFSPTIHLKDEHRGLLHYHITNPHLPLSKIFSQMEVIKNDYTFVEDYTVSDTTLEQVFIAFAKRQAVLNTSTE